MQLQNVTPDGPFLSDMTINGLRTLKDHVKLCELFQATREAHKVYGKRLSNEKELLKKKGHSEDGEKEAKRWREGKTTGSTEAGTKGDCWRVSPNMCLPRRE